MKESPRAIPQLNRIFIPLIVLLLALALFQIARIVEAANRVQSDLAGMEVLAQDGALNLFQSDQLGALDGQLARSAQDLRDLRATIGPLIYLAPSLGWIPRYGGDIANAPALLDLTEQTITSARAALTIGESLENALQAGRASNATVGQALVQVAQEQSQQIQQARSDLAATVQIRPRIDTAALSPSLQAEVSRFDQALPELQTALDGLILAPILLGGDHPRVYLLLLQNSDELRATGGFISGVAELRVDRGAFTLNNFQDSYAIFDPTKIHPNPPAPLHDYMDAPQWVFRDANWSPDFPTTARAAESLYQLDTGVSVDGVIAVNLKVLPRFMNALGSVSLPDYAQAVDQTNVVEQIESYWGASYGPGQNGDWWAHRKDFIGKLLDAMLARLRNGDVSSAALSQALLDSIAAKDLLVYVNDARATDWSNGAVAQTPGDALMIVDSNVGFNKVDAAIDRHAEYTVSLAANGAASATLKLTYTNLSPASPQFCVHVARYLASYAELQQGCYWNYVRVVAAPRAQFLAATNGIDAHAEDSIGNRSVFAGYLIVAGGEKRTVEYDYQIPHTVVNGNSYHLLIEKQAGAPTWSVQVNINLPADWNGFTANPPPQKVNGHVLEYAFNIDRGVELVIQKQDTTNVALPVLALGALVVVSGVGLTFWRRRLLIRRRGR